MKKLLSVFLSAILCVSLVACGNSTQEEPVSEETTSEQEEVQETDATATTAVETNLSTIDNTKWQYNSDDDVYYQIGISYCENPADESYETLAIFVPGAYMNATDNGDGTYTCELNAEGTINGYTAETAPIVMPINTPGYSAQGVKFSDHCEVCYACLHNCPKSAIHMPLEAGEAHYRNEHVTLADIIESNE